MPFCSWSSSDVASSSWRSLLAIFCSYALCYLIKDFISLLLSCNSSSYFLISASIACSRSSMLQFFSVAKKRSTDFVLPLARAGEEPRALEFLLLPLLPPLKPTSFWLRDLIDTFCFFNLTLSFYIYNFYFSICSSYFVPLKMFPTVSPNCDPPLWLTALADPEPSRLLLGNPRLYLSTCFTSLCIWLSFWMLSSIRSLISFF